MHNFLWHKEKHTNSKEKLFKQVINDLKSDIKTALYNGNYSKVERLKKEIAKIEKLNET